MLAFIIGILHLCTPLLFAALGGLFCERSGVINIALEGFMLMGAFVGSVIALKFGSPLLAFLGAGLGGCFIAAIYAFAVIPGRANQIVAGTAINLLVMGAIPMMTKILYDSTGGGTSLNASQKFDYFPLWFVWVLLLAVTLVMERLPLGFWISFSGENPEALDAAGIRVNRVRTLAVLLSGVLAGWGGATLSLCLASGYTRNMVAGRGFMALAALIFGRWKPLPTAFACLFFGLMENLQIRLQSSSDLIAVVPAQFVQMIPYIATILVLAGFVVRSRPPSALGNLFEKA